MDAAGCYGGDVFAGVGLECFEGHVAGGKELGWAEDREGAVQVPFDDHVERDIVDEAAETGDEDVVEAGDGVGRVACLLEFPDIGSDVGEGGAAGLGIGREELVAAGGAGSGIELDVGEFVRLDVGEEEIGEGFAERDEMVITPVPPC